MSNVKAATGREASPESGGFVRISDYDELLSLSESDNDAFMLRTSEATRRMLIFYQRERDRSETHTDADADKV